MLLPLALIPGSRFVIIRRRCKAAVHRSLRDGIHAPCALPRHWFDNLGRLPHHRANPEDDSMQFLFLPRRGVMLRIVVLVALGLTGGCAHRHAVPAGSGPGVALQQRQADFIAALLARDAGHVSGFFAEDAVVHVANMPPMQGREAILRLYENVFRFLRASDYAVGETRVSTNADMAWTAGSVTTVFEGREGPVEFPGKFLLVWHHRGGAWEVVAYSVGNNRADAAR
jgi:ketosteroid isomerase-like protein